MHTKQIFKYIVLLVIIQYYDMTLYHNKVHIGNGPFGINTSTLYMYMVHDLLY